MRKNGFTLIELLAVIIVLSIVAVITVPVVLDVIDNAKSSSLELSVRGYVDSINKALGTYSLENDGRNFSEGIHSINENNLSIEYDGSNFQNGVFCVVDNSVYSGVFKKEDKYFLYSDNNVFSMDDIDDDIFSTYSCD